MKRRLVVLAALVAVLALPIGVQAATNAWFEIAGDPVGAEDTLHIDKPEAPGVYVYNLEFYVNWDQGTIYNLASDLLATQGSGWMGTANGISASWDLTASQLLMPGIIYFNGNSLWAGLTGAPPVPWGDNATIAADGGLQSSPALGDGTYPAGYLPAIVIHQIPEPGTLALLGLGGLALIRRRR